VLRRHCPQWQAITGRKAPDISYRTAPHRQPPLALLPLHPLLVSAHKTMPPWRQLSSERPCIAAPHFGRPCHGNTAALNFAHEHDPILRRCRLAWSAILVPLVQPGGPKDLASGISIHAFKPGAAFHQAAFCFSGIWIKRMPN
jgi:hypothetical protein